MGAGALTELIPGYQLRAGSGLDRAMLLKFMALTYQELYPNVDFGHLGKTVEEYFSPQTPLWWVDVADSENLNPQGEAQNPPTLRGGSRAMSESPLQVRVRQTVGCLWLGNAIDQRMGDRHAHIFLLYVAPAHRRRGIGKAIVSHAENWARARGDRQIGLQVFLDNEPALNLYRNLGYQPHSLWMLKSFENYDL